MRNVVLGLLFAMLWASASVATKVGVAQVHPLLLANIRFFIAGGLMLGYAYGLQGSKNTLPRGLEWKHLLIFSLLNTTIYLGAFVLALKEVSAGIGSLSVATNPLFITLLSAVWLRRPLRVREGWGILLGLAGVALATYPLLQNSYATLKGLFILLAGMISVSAATVYYAQVKWKLSSLVINGWQVLLGGICLLPFTIYFTNLQTAHFNADFWGAVFWLIGPVSIVSLQLWFFLIKQDAVRASLWLFMCPIFGFFYSYTLLGEPITTYTFAGTALVIAGLYLAQREKFTK
ncbi:EamA family transporter [Adhaeribacter arboris]|uniref:EamA family transporter n=1 Tax=Adhaeribacter arboris TaxID=2072846 RepID=A0A2T2YD45_9BACT|nr:DMT family transporter [Adhaeribacter arboris]PSR53442.1 EamA family transporter [Adhaeribacter arboris]